MIAQRSLDLNSGSLHHVNQYSKHRDTTYIWHIISH